MSGQDDDLGQRLARLAAMLLELRGQDDGFLLYVGSGASMVDGVVTKVAIRRTVMQAAWGGGLPAPAVSAMRPAELDAQFTQVWPEVPRTMRGNVIAQSFGAVTPSRGHRALARLWKSGFLSAVLTGNADMAIEAALFGSDWQPNEWQVIHSNAPLDEFRDDIQRAQPRAKLIKLGGNIQDRNIPISGQELQTRLERIRDPLQSLTRRGIIVVGYTEFDDPVFRYLSGEGEKIYLIGDAEPGSGSEFKRCLHNRHPRFIINEDLTFDRILSELANRLHAVDEAERMIGTTIPPSAVAQVAPGPEESQPTEMLVELIKSDRTDKRGPDGPAEAGADTGADADGGADADADLVSIVRRTRFIVQLDQDRNIKFAVQGRLNFETPDAVRWQAEIREYMDLVEDLGEEIALGLLHGQDHDQLSRWRRRAKSDGQRLFRDLSGAHPELGLRLGVARETAESPDHLTLVFQTPRELLGAPFELLHDGQRPLVVQHPLVHRISGVGYRHGKDLDAFAAALRRQNEKLRVLLIASDTGGLSADGEIDAIKQTIQQSGGWSGAEPDITCLGTEEASIDTVREALRQCRHHIVHFAGHGAYDPRQPENSGLLFWKRRNRGGGVELLNCRQLGDLLNGGETQLMSLNACQGARSGASGSLRGSDFLGIMDAVVMAGVPYVLGYRWQVTDTGSNRLSRAFFHSLFLKRPLAPERALLQARKDIYGGDGDDETWMSPVMVAQYLLP